MFQKILRDVFEKLSEESTDRDIKETEYYNKDVSCVISSTILRV